MCIRDSRSPFIVILNDNEMSIAPNVGSIAAYLSVLRTKPFANFVRRTGKEMLKRLPLGTAAKRAIEGAEIGAMHFIGPAEKTAVIFEELGFRYIGPVDGHNYDVLVDALQTAKDFDRPDVYKRQELGYQATSVTTALERAVTWYRQNGMA